MRPLTRIAIVTSLCFLAAACYKLQAADDMKMMEGTVVSAESGTLVMNDDKSHEHSYSVDSSVQIMMDGKMAKLEDLKKNMSVNVALDGEKVMSVNASNPMKVDSN